MVFFGHVGLQSHTWIASVAVIVLSDNVDFEARCNRVVAQGWQHRLEHPVSASQEFLNGIVQD
jgi:hypothetical protein